MTALACDVCDLPLSDDDVHTNSVTGGDCHGTCCPTCRPTVVVSWFDLNAALSLCLLIEDRAPSETASLDRLQAALNASAK